MTAVAAGVHVWLAILHCGIRKGYAYRPFWFGRRSRSP